MKIRFKQALSKNNPTNPYHCKGWRIEVGEVVDVPKELGSRLLCDFPGKFVEVLGDTELEIVPDSELEALEIDVMDTEEKKSARKRLNALKRTTKKDK